MTEFAVMPEGTKLLPGDRVTLVITVPEDGSMRVQSRDEDIRVVERPVSEVELPTAPGYYVSVRSPLIGGPGVFRLTDCGEWKFEGHRYSKDDVRESMPLTRLVPETEAAPAKLADRLDRYQVGLRMNHIRSDNKFYSEEGAELIAAIDNGELDK